MGHNKESYFYPTESTNEIQQIVALCKEAGLRELYYYNLRHYSGISVNLHYNYYCIYTTDDIYRRMRRISLLKLILLLEQRIDENRLQTST